MKFSQEIQFLCKWSFRQKSISRDFFSIMLKTDHNTSWAENQTLREGKHESLGYWSCRALHSQLARPNGQRFGSHF